MASLLVYLMISSPERGASMLESESLRSLHRDWEQYPRGRRQGAGRLLFVSTHRLPSTTHHCLAMPRVTMSHCHSVTMSHHPTITSSLREKEMFAQLKAGRWGEWDDHALAGRTTLGNYWELQTHGNVWSTAAPIPVLHSDGKGQHDWHDYKLSIPQPDTRNNHQGVLSAN